jgi:hypothetical protein
MVKLKLTQKQIDILSTTLGIISGIAGVLTTNHIFDPQVGSLLSEVPNLAVAILVGKLGTDIASKTRI